MIVDTQLFDTQSNTEALVVKQLAEGTYRHAGDSAPSDWVARVWQDLPSKEAGWVAMAVHNALLHETPTIRAEALRTLDIAPKMANGYFLLDVVQNHFDLFRGLQRKGDSPNADRGRDLVLLTAGVVSGELAHDFRRTMATDPDYGLHVLASLTQKDVDWVVENGAKLVNDQLDPTGVRLGVILFNLRKDEKRLTQLVKNIGGSGVVDNGRLTTTIQNKIKDKTLQDKLLVAL